MTLNPFFLGVFIGALAVELILTSILLLLINKIGRPSRELQRVIVASVLSLIIYTAAESYSNDIPPREAFNNGLLPQLLICIAYLYAAKNRKPTPLETSSSSPPAPPPPTAERGDGMRVLEGAILRFMTADDHVDRVAKAFGRPSVGRYGPPSWLWAVLAIALAGAFVVFDWPKLRTLVDYLNDKPAVSSVTPMTPDHTDQRAVVAQVAPQTVPIAPTAPVPPALAVMQANDQPKPEGCPLEIAVQRVDKFVDETLEQLSASSLQLLNGMAEINNKATRPGIPIKDQLSSSDLARFNDLRHESIEISVTKLRFSALKRNVRLIRSVYELARMVDIYELKKDQLSKTSPLLFYMTVLEELRLAQPRVTITKITNTDTECDPEVGLYWEEQFNQGEINKGGVDQRLVNLIFDIERLRNLYQLDSNLFKRALDDLKKVKWVGDQPNYPDTESDYLETSSAAIQDMNNVVTPFIDSNLPSDAQVESWFMQKQVENATTDFPVKKK